MSRWLQAEGLPVTFGDLPEVQIVALAQLLRDKFADTIDARSFEELLADKENAPPAVLSIVQEVQKRPPLHDKFWRYLELFSDTVNTHDE